MSSIKSVIKLFAFCYPVFASANIMMQNGWVAESETYLPGTDSIASTVQAPGGYTAAPLRWFGQASDNGPNITVIGQNFAQIFDHLKELNPDFEKFNEERLRAQPNYMPALPRRELAERAELEKRQDSHTLCDRPEFLRGDIYTFTDGINYLRHLSSWCVVDGGKGSCNRCSCSYNSGIWMCNDSNNGVTHQYMYCTDMGDRAAGIIDYCRWRQNLQQIGNGQWFRHDTEYSVLMAGDKC